MIENDEVIISPLYVVLTKYHGKYSPAVFSSKADAERFCFDCGYPFPIYYATDRTKKKERKSMKNNDDEFYPNTRNQLPERIREVLLQVLDDAGYIKTDDTFFTPDEKPQGGGICAETAGMCIEAITALTNYIKSTVTDGGNQ